MPGGGSKFNVQELKDRKMGNFHVLGLEMSKMIFGRQNVQRLDCPMCWRLYFQPKVERPEANSLQ
jgi:hypothetical protein